MTGYVAPVAGFVHHFSAVEAGNRYMFRLDFARISQNISLDLRVGAGQDMVDFGGVLKFFHHWYFQAPTTSATGLSAGLGAGAMVRSITATQQAGGARGHRDILLTPFLRFLYDSTYGFGFFVDVGMEMVPKRTYTTAVPGALDTDSTFRNRFFFALGIPFGA